jgi:AraC-like DNA-binding protein
MGGCKGVLLSIGFVLCSFMVLGQEEVDSLINFSNKKLIDRFYANYTDSIKANVYANRYLLRAKKLNDTINIADGYYFKSLIADDPDHKKYNDSIITLTKDIKIENKFHPIIAYFNNGDQYYKEKKFDLALDSYLSALNSNVNISNKELFYEIKHRIGLLKSRYGDDQEALDLYMEVYNYYSQVTNPNYRLNNKLPIVFAVSDGYLRLGKLDSAAYYIDKGKLESRISKDSAFENYFNFQDGLVDFKKGNYFESISKIENSMPLISILNDFGNITCGNYYLGESFLKINKTQKAIEKFKTIDSVYQITHDIHPDYRRAYEHLIKYHETTGNLKEELKYVKKLLEVDQNLNLSYKIISKNLAESYDTPKLINEKNRIINQINSSSNLKSFLIVISTIFLAGILAFLIISLKRKKRVEENFRKLLDDSVQIIEPVVVDTNSKNEVPEEIIKLIKVALMQFEKERKYLEKNLKLTTMADRFNTNTKYLSAILNQHMGISFSNYLSNLRVSFAIDNLKKDPKFRMYTIRAIAEESGFNNSESFSKSFYKKTGMRPSLFIKKLTKISLDS